MATGASCGSRWVYERKTGTLGGCDGALEAASEDSSMLRLDIGQSKVPLALQDSALKRQMGSKERSHVAHMGAG